MGRRNGCAGKVRHANKTRAVMALKLIGNAGLSSYPCPRCKGWHLGTSSNPVKVQARITQLLARPYGFSSADPMSCATAPSSGSSTSALPACQDGMGPSPIGSEPLTAPRESVLGIWMAGIRQFAMDLWTSLGRYEG